jgi:hypothetical protein
VRLQRPLRHDALVYESQDDYVTRAAGFLREGLDAGEAAVVGDTPPGLRMMRDALGPDAERVAFYDTGSVYTRPARALAAYHAVFLNELRHARSVRAVAQAHAFAPADWDEWASYESLTNVAYAHLPVWVVCAYDATSLPEEIVDGARHTHTGVLTAEWHESQMFEDPRTFVRRRTGLPTTLPQLRSVPVPGDLDAFGECLAREAANEGVPSARVLDLVVAGNELAANAIRHGGGIRELRVGRADERFVCEVVDRGAGFDSTLAGYLAPRAGPASGLWIVRQLCWRLEFFDSGRGFTGRLWL